MVRLAFFGAALSALVACVDDPCGQYVDYICICHDDDPAFDCADLQRTYTSDDPDLVDQCAIDLALQKAEDQAAGLDCNVESDPL